MTHIPVMAIETIKYLAPSQNKPHKKYIDATLGEGGHAKNILEAASPTGQLLGIEWDPQIVQIASKNLKNFDQRVKIVISNYTKLDKVAKDNDFGKVDGILLDLGMSSWQLLQGGRGFSFQKDEPLDMRYNPGSPKDAQYIINRYPENQLADIFWRLADERYSRRIAKAIVEARQKEKITRSAQLADLVATVVSRRGKMFGFAKDFSRRMGQIHPATRVFQALRIEVNQELENLQKVLPQAVDILNRGGRLVVISFHSNEDRIVKNFFKGEKRLKILTKKPLRPSWQEIKENPASRSAKMRVAEKE